MNFYTDYKIQIYTITLWCPRKTVAWKSASCQRQWYSHTNDHIRRDDANSSRWTDYRAVRVYRILYNIYQYLGIAKLSCVIKFLSFYTSLFHSNEIDELMKSDTRKLLMIDDSESATIAFRSPNHDESIRVSNSPGGTRLTLPPIYYSTIKLRNTKKRGTCT